MKDDADERIDFAFELIGRSVPGEKSKTADDRFGLERLDGSTAEIIFEGKREWADLSAFGEELSLSLVSQMTSACGSFEDAAAALRLASKAASISKKHITVRKGELKLASATLRRFKKRFVLLSEEKAPVRCFETVFAVGEAPPDVNQDINTRCFLFGAREEAVSRIPKNTYIVEIKREES